MGRQKAGWVRPLGSSGAREAGCKERKGVWGGRRNQRVWGPALLDPPPLTTSTQPGEAIRNPVLQVRKLWLRKVK